MLPIQRQFCRLGTTAWLPRIPSVRLPDAEWAGVANISQKRQLSSSRGDVPGNPLIHATINWPGYTNWARHRILVLRPVATRSHKYLSPTSSGRNYSTSQSTKNITVDDYIQEIEDLYAIAKDELEIAAESTAAATIYAASDRISMREAFDDLNHAYGAYADNNPPPEDIESKDGGDGTGITEVRSTSYDSTNIPAEVRAEIKRRVGHRIREIENAVKSLEESAQHE
ncbi:hypothetical protein MGYG_06664 [Nannizzia gypsea CBS 118893]|uniref:Uncharacterized protein n=1 Tax=Arthroderma gypseum (strain ATCC MYA-4604 / CBS 118893) TaxID=535722 RepID=E4V0V3_ARTGP|nr:hypothetical protein MGYG_06664 [Nannizzia gypsea CBS 118893]EFR03668.1 hypothetical protein MGYG_06664 [Nannizzia gypsea CBS 118893]